MPHIDIATLRDWRIMLESSFYVDGYETGNPVEYADPDDVRKVLAAIERAEQDAYREEARRACLSPAPQGLRP